MSKKKQSVLSFQRKSCVIATEIALAMMVAPVALAQQAAAPSKVEKIEVTGTRLPPANLEASSPINVITADDIYLEGARNVENMLNNLPQVFAGQGSAYSNGATGTATVNLRGLGSSRTLVLVNGRRLPAGSPLIYAADLNQIPAALIQRVEVLTGGASAVYGSDAVAGVVNFIMNDKFQGVRGEVNYNFYNHSQDNPKSVQDTVSARAASNPSQFKVPGDKSRDGEQSDYNLTLGSNFADGKGNATVFLGYQKTRALLQSERDYSACTLGYVSTTASNFACGGSSTSFPGRFIRADGASFTVADANGTVRNYSSALDQYNFGPLNYYQRPNERYTGAAFANYEINSSAKVYSELGFHNDRTVAQIAPSGVFILPVTVRADNPLLSTSWRNTLGLNAPGSTADILLGRRNVEGGGRQNDLEHTSFRGVMGIKGEIDKNWNYDVSTQVGRVNYANSYLNDFSITRIGRALDVVRDPVTGAAVCRSVLDGTDPNCVPYNIWRLGGVTPAAVNYLAVPLLARGYTEQRVQTATLSTDLGAYGIQAPMAKSGVAIAFGAERRVEKLDFLPDNNYATGDGAGQGGPTIGLGGQYTVRDFFIESRAPLIEGKEFADLLSLNGSFRQSSYSTGQNANSYGIGADWAPTRTIRVRGSYQQAVRAANIIELFSAQSIGLYDNDRDPCAGTAPSRSQADCARTGVTAAQYGRILDNPAGQYNALYGGNPSLKPETGKTQTLGLVLSPMKNLNVAVDYFNFKVEDVVGTVSPVTALTQCLNTGNSTFCGLIQRDQFGSLWISPNARIIATNLNLGKLKTSGFDLSADYTMKIQGYGGVNLSAIGTYLRSYEVEELPGLGSYNCSGYYGGACGTPNPTWRHRVRSTWQTPWNLDVSLTWRHFGAVDTSRSSSNPLLAGTVYAVDKTLAAQNYIDLAASYAVTKQITVRAGINNLTDRDPPISANVGAGAGNGNTFPQVYDALGRRVFMSLTAKF